MSDRTIDYSLYLVTGRELLPPGVDYYASLEEALKGGVTVVQVREKKVDTGEFLEIARKTKELCIKYNVPLIINDRVDIALAVKADGVHIGQSDMPATIARSILPIGSIIGVSVNTPEEAATAVKNGADYVGIGPIWPTNTKTDIKNLLGPRGVGPILQQLEGSNMRSVAIAGINSGNVLRTLHGAVTPSGRTLDGVAVVSAIMASRQPREAARELFRTIHAFVSPPAARYCVPPVASIDEQQIIRGAAELLSKLRESTPVIHQITNNVTINQSANVTLALGGSPIMATSPQEMEDLSKISGSLLVNFGTISDKAGMLEAGRWVNTRKNPIIFDPVGVGATSYRFSTAQELLNAWQASVIKGNAAEIGALAKSDEVKSKGVDAVGGGFANPGPMLKRLARAERCVIAMTGKTDWISDGEIVISCSNGNKLLGEITGGGCIVGTSIAAFCAAANLAGQNSLEHYMVRGDMLTGTIAGILAITIASELAASREDVKGSGTFLPALIDELYNLTPEKIVDKARLEIHL